MDDKDLMSYFVDSNIPTDEAAAAAKTVDSQKDRLLKSITDEKEKYGEKRQGREQILILLAVWDNEYAEKYKEFFTNQGIRTVSVSNEDEFFGFARVFPINGVVADYSSKTAQTAEAKTLMLELEQNYPYLRAKYNPETNSFDCFHSDNNIKTIENFIEEKCLYFQARALRANERKPISLNVEISPEKEFLRVEKTVTLNVSSTGLFVLATSSIWDDAKKCFIIIKEFNNETFIECKIARRIKWGEKPFTAPGIGVEIALIHDSLKDDFQMLLEKWRLC